MVAHTLKIGERIFDIHDMRWGTILLIQGEEKDAYVEFGDEIVLYKPDDSYGECECMAEEAYPLVPNLEFWDWEVCWEINVDDFDHEHNYDYYCPEMDENCWDFECIEK